MNSFSGRGKGGGRGQKGGNRTGKGGYCICPQCNERIEHQQGVPCYSVKCPKCGQNMTRQ